MFDSLFLTGGSGVNAPALILPRKQDGCQNSGTLRTANLTDELKRFGIRCTGLVNLLPIFNCLKSFPPRD